MKHSFVPKSSIPTICSSCGGMRITTDHGYDMMKEASRAIMDTILDVLKLESPARIHPRYLPEVCALHCQNKLHLITANQTVIKVTRIL